MITDTIIGFCLLVYFAICVVCILLLTFALWAALALFYAYCVGFFHGV